MYELSISRNIDDPRITNFLLNDQRSSIYHHPAWLRSLCDAYGGEPFYVIIKKRRSEKIEGIAPFIMFGKKTRTKIVSLPFTNYCDFILPESIDVKSVLEYIDSQIGPVSEFDLRVLKENPIDGFSNSSDHLIHIIELKPTPEETFNSFGRRSIRRLIKKADDNDLTFRLGETEKDLKIFYDLEVTLRRSIGLPPAPYRFFYSIWSNLKKQNMVFLPIVSIDNIPIAASLILYFKDRIYFEYTGLSKKHKNLYGNHKIHWEMINKAQSEYNVKFVEMGRVSADHKSLIFFKENWNAKPYKVFHKRYPSQKKDNLFSKFFGFSFPVFKSINKKLPTFLIKLEGRYIYKYFKILFFCCLIP